MKIAKIKTRSFRVLASVIILLLILTAGIGLVYGVGLVSPLTEILPFVMIFGAPGVVEIMISGVITIVPFGILGLIAWIIYKVAKVIYRSFS